MALTKPRLGQFNTTVSSLSDPLTVLNAGATTANVDIGFLMNRANGLVSNVAMIWKESTQSFVVCYTTDSGSTNSNITPASYANLTVGNITATDIFWANGSTLLSGASYSSTGSGNVTISGNTISLTTIGPGQVNAGSATSIPTIVTDEYGRIVSLTSNAVSTTISLAGTAGTGSVAGGGTLTFLGTNGFTAIVSGSTVTLTDTVWPAANANIGTLSTSLSTLHANVGLYQIDTNANLGTATTNITTLFSNSATQATSLNSIDANLGTATNNITTLFSNAATQATSVNIINANLGTATTNITTLQTQVYTNSNVSAYLPTYSGTIGGTLSTALQPNITAVGTLTSLAVTNNATVGGNLNVSGNLNVTGTLVTFNSNNLVIDDSIIYVANNNSGDVVDIGLVGSFINPGYQHTGLVRDASDGVWKLFSNVVPEPTTTVDFTNAIYSNLKIGNLSATSTTLTGTLILPSVGDVSANIGAYQITTNANLGTATTNITTLFSNAATQATSLNSINANLGTATTNITTLFSNAATQGTAITGITNGTTTLANVITTGGVFWANGTAYGGGGGGTTYTSTGAGNITVSGSTLALTATGPGAVTVGSATSIPTIVTDAYGRVISLTSNAVSTTISLAAGSGSGSVAGGGTLTVSGGGNVTTSVTGSTYTINSTNAGVTGLFTSGAGNITVSSATGGVSVTLPATGPGAASVGSSTAIPVITTDAYGRISATTTAAVIAPAGTLSGTTLASGVTASSLTSFGASPTLVTPALGTPASGNFSTGTFTWPTFNQSTTGSAATLTTSRNINGVAFNGSADITVHTSSGAGNVTISGTAINLTSAGPGAASVGSSTAIPVITTDAYGRVAGTSTAAVVAPAGTLSGTTLNSTVTASSLTSLGNLTSLSVSGTSSRGGKAMVTNFTGAAAPANPQQGDEWWYTTGNILYKYINDGTTSTWVNINSSLYNASTSATANTLALRDASGNLTATNFLGLASSAKYADLAEIYESDSDYAPGTVVVFGGEQEITVTDKSHDSRVAGVISTNPAYLMNSECVGLPVAFTGRVPCQVQGPVKKGDLLVTSNKLGVAQAIDNTQFVPGCVIGKSLENITTKTIATIEVVVGRF